jgi:hypothetical protein
LAAQGVVAQIGWVASVEPHSDTTTVAGPFRRVDDDRCLRRLRRLRFHRELGHDLLRNLRGPAGDSRRSPLTASSNAGANETTAAAERETKRGERI